ncbi:Putative metallopeptidase [Mycobacteriaceae bacterium]
MLRGLGSRSGRAAILLCALVIVGCGAAEVDPHPGRMVVSYGDATSPEATRGHDLMKNTSLLEELAADVNSVLKLPRDVALVGEQCGQANATWNSADRSIKICYELVDLNLRLFGVDDAPNSFAEATNATIGTFFHELAHAVISLYDLPVTGREEDVADQLAAFAILEPDGVLKNFPNPGRVAEDYAQMFTLWAVQRGALAPSDFAAAHSINETRTFNLNCWIYGSDPAAHADMITDGRLPEDRAAGCPEEYQRLSKAWTKLLTPYLK